MRDLTGLTFHFFPAKLGMLLSKGYWHYIFYNSFFLLNEGPWPLYPRKNSDKPQSAPRGWAFRQSVSVSFPRKIDTVSWCHGTVCGHVGARHCNALTLTPTHSVVCYAGTLSLTSSSIKGNQVSQSKCQNVAVYCSHVTIYYVMTSQHGILLENETEPGSRKAIISNYLQRSKAPHYIFSRAWRSRTFTQLTKKNE